MPEEKPDDSPAPEVLQTQEQVSEQVAEAAATGATVKKELRPKRALYKPSHKATFVGLAVVIAIIAINVGIVLYVLRGQQVADKQFRAESVVLSPETLNKLGVNRNPVGTGGTELIVGPNSRFQGKVTIGNDVNISGQLNLNNKVSATEASLSKLDAGNTSLNQLNVNNDATVSNLSARRDLVVAGTTRLQGTVSMAQLLTVNNNVNITGNAAIGGTLSVRNFQASSLTSDTTLTIGGHIISRGNSPTVTAGPGVGQNGTVSVGGSDSAGTVAVNTGVGATGGIVANIRFARAYASMPRVVVTAVGAGLGSVYVSRSAEGFSIGVNGAIAPGGYAFDYIVIQ